MARRRSCLALTASAYNLFLALFHMHIYEPSKALRMKVKKAREGKRTTKVAEQAAV